MQNVDENTITGEALRRMVNAPSPRAREVLASLVQHLHDFAREVSLTEEEWFEAIKFLTDTGHITTDKRQEFVLLSDVLGLSMLVIAQNNRKPPGCTESTVFGPFRISGAPTYPLGADIANGAKGEPCYVNAVVKGIDGEPVAGAAVEVWQADADGLYDVQYLDSDVYRARGILHADAAGKVYFRSITPYAYPVPTDGPVGRLLVAMGRHPWRPAHMHFMVEAPGYERLVTHVFRSDDDYLQSDAVFGVRSSLVADWKQWAGGTGPQAQACSVPYHSLDFEFVLNPSR